MESLSTRELYARNTENEIILIKEKGDAVVECATGLVVNIKSFASAEGGEALDWILSCLEGDTEQREAGKLTEEQLRYASIVVSAVADCATIGV